MRLYELGLGNKAFLLQIFFSIFGWYYSSKQKNIAFNYRLDCWTSSHRNIKHERNVSKSNQKIPIHKKNQISVWATQKTNKQMNKEAVVSLKFIECFCNSAYVCFQTFNLFQFQSLQILLLYASFTTSSVNCQTRFFCQPLPNVDLILEAFLWYNARNNIFVLTTNSSLPPEIQATQETLQFVFNTKFIINIS